MAAGDHYFIGGSKLYDLIRKPFTGCQSLKIEGFKDENSDINFTPLNFPFASWVDGSEKSNMIVSLPFHYQNGSYDAVKKNFKATLTNFHTIQGPFRGSIRYTDDSLIIGSVTFPASTFRDGIVPHIITIEFCGGGGGGGGGGGSKPGCGGSGSDTVKVSIDLSQTTYYPYMNIHIGAGGSGGIGAANEDSSHRGNDGELSSLYTTEDEVSIEKGRGGGMKGNPGTRIGDTTFLQYSRILKIDIYKPLGGGGDAGKSGGGCNAGTYTISTNQTEINSGLFTNSTSNKSGGAGSDAGGGGSSALGVGGSGGNSSAGGNGGYGAGGGGGDAVIFDGKNGGAGGPGYAYFYY